MFAKAGVFMKGVLSTLFRHFGKFNFYTFYQNYKKLCKFNKLDVYTEAFLHENDFSFSGELF